MNKKFQKIILLFLLIITLTGCTKRFTVEDKEDNTKKAYVSNIICKPESEDLLKIYTDNAKEQKIDIDNLYIKFANMIQCFGNIEDIEYNQNDTEQKNIIKTAAILLNKKIFSDSYIHL